MAESGSLYGRINTDAYDMKDAYQSPEIEILEMSVEAGYQSSATSEISIPAFDEESWE